jgi:DNA-binding CsgD family transcriptional regulator
MHILVGSLLSGRIIPIKTTPCIALLGLILAFSFGCSAAHDSIRPRASNGILDLSTWRFEEKTVKLSGEWKFYWNRLLEPEDLADPDLQSTSIKVPGLWSDLVMDGAHLPKTGYGTYELLIRLDGHNETLGLKIYQVGTAYKLWIDGEPLVACGVVGTDEKSMTGLIKPQAVYFTPRKSTVQIVLQVSNFKDRFGGIWTDISLGDGRKIAVQNYVDIGADMIFFGIFFIIGLYFAISFAFTRHDRSLLYFGICCLLIGIRTLSAGEVFLMTIFPGFDFEINYKIQFLSQCIATPFFVMFLRALFPDEIHVAAVRMTQALMAVYGISIVSTPLIAYSNLLSPYCIFLALGSLYISFRVVMAVIRKRNEALIALFGLAALCVSVVNDILYANVLIQTGYILPFGLIAFSLVFIVILSIRFSRLQSAARERIRMTELDERSKDDLCEKHGISRREREVIPYLMQGMGYKGIAGRLFISVSTLRKHIHSIYGKFNVRNRTEMDYFLRTGGRKT